ncbi:MAG: hypothetical protein H7195_10480 [Chryseobacterium sp.]|nr:hypothetical protein [Chryseobacterium sp.]
MTIKNLLRIIFRIFGLYTVLNLIFNFLPSQITYLINAKLLFPYDAENGILQTWIYLAIVVVLIFITLYLLIINPELIIKILRPKSFLEERINFEKLNAEILVQIAILSLGILLLFDSIPELINKLFSWFKINNMNQNITSSISTINIKTEIIVSGLKCFIGLVFILFQGSIGKMLYRQNINEGPR